MSTRPSGSDRITPRELQGRHGYEPALRTNIYPGVIKLGSVQLGHFVWMSETAGFVTGFTLGTLPLGFGLSNNYPMYVGDH